MVWQQKKGVDFLAAPWIQLIRLMCVGSMRKDKYDEHISNNWDLLKGIFWCQKKLVNFCDVFFPSRHI